MQKNTEKCDQSRRNLLKKGYTAPAMIALGSMSFSTDANAWGWRRKHWHHGGHSSGGSSLSGGSKCNICRRFPCCCH